MLVALDCSVSSWPNPDIRTLTNIRRATARVANHPAHFSFRAALRRERYELPFTVNRKSLYRSPHFLLVRCESRSTVKG